VRGYLKSGTIIGAFVLLFGCEAPAGAPGAVIQHDSAGVRIIDLPIPSGEDRRIELTLDSSWNPAGDLETGDLLDMDLVPNRGILLLDELGEKVSFISNSGEVVVVMGRRGEGPGEFNPQGLSQVMATDSSLFVPDLFLQRLTEFSLSGEVLDMRTFPLSPVYAVDWRRHPNGGLAFRAFEQFGDQIIRLAGESLDTLLSLQISNDFENLLLAPVTVWDLTDDGNAVVARTDRAAVELREAGTGNLIWKAQWPEAAEELAETDVSHLEALLRERILRDAPNISAELLAQNLASIEYPTRAPVLAGLMVRQNGDIWVRWANPVQSMGLEALQVGSAEVFGGRDWDILDESGVLKERVRLPEGFAPRRFYGNRVYGILVDGLGIETVARVEVDF